MPIPVPGVQLVTLTHVEDVASMLAAVPGNKAAVGQHYNVVSDRAITFQGERRKRFLCTGASVRAVRFSSGKQAASQQQTLHQHRRNCLQVPGQGAQNGAALPPPPLINPNLPSPTSNPQASSRLCPSPWARSPRWCCTALRRWAPARAARRRASPSGAPGRGGMMLRAALQFPSTGGWHRRGRHAVGLRLGVRFF